MGTTQNLVQAAADAATGGNVSALARLIETPGRTVRQWQSGKTGIPGAATMLLSLLAERRVCLFHLPALALQQVRIRPRVRSIDPVTYRELPVDDYAWIVKRADIGEIEIESPTGYVKTIKASDIADVLRDSEGVYFVTIRWQWTLCGSRVLEEPVPAMGEVGAPR